MAWFGGRDLDVDALIARKQYGKAIARVEQQLRREPRSVRLRQLQADLMARDGREEGAVEILRGLVEEFVAEGFVAKAVAVLKKVQRIAPGQPEVEARLAELVKRREGEAGEAHPGVRRPAPPGQGAGEAAAAGEGGEAEPGAEVEEEPSQPGAEVEEEPSQPGFHYSPLFSDLSESELAAVIGGLKLRVEPPGSILLTEGEPGDSLFILTTGWARVYRRDGAGRNRQIGMLEEGDFFGEAALLTGGVRTATVTAASDCELLELDRPTFDGLVAAYPGIGEVVREFHARRAGRDAPPGGS